jgi:hypothetical protein
VINPLIIPFGVIYFGLAYLTERHNVVYVYSLDFPSEASWYPAVFTRLVWGVIVCQFVVAAILGLHRFPYAAILFVAFVATIMFWVWADRQLHGHFKYGVINPALPDAVFEERDAARRWPVAATYRYPTLRPMLFRLEDQRPEVPEQEENGWWPVSCIFWCV